MKVEVKDVLNDIKFIGASVVKVYFVAADGQTMYPPMPAIDRWNSGTVRVDLRSGALATKMIERLARYGVTATADQTNANDNIITFQCAAGDDIIQLFSQALSMQRLQTKSRLLDDMHENVKQMAKQIPYVQSSMFSRGVKNLRNSAETLNNVVIAQRKELCK